MNQVQRFCQVVTIRELLESGKVNLDERVVVTQELTPSFKINKNDPFTVREYEELAGTLGFGCLEFDNSDSNQILFYSGLTADNENIICEWEDETIYEWENEDEDEE